MAITNTMVALRTARPVGITHIAMAVRALSESAIWRGWRPRVLALFQGARGLGLRGHQTAGTAHVGAAGAAAQRIAAPISDPLLSKQKATHDKNSTTRQPAKARRAQPPGSGGCIRFCLVMSHTAVAAKVQMPPVAMPIDSSTAPSIVSFCAQCS